MVVTEAMEVMDTERERLKLSQGMDMEVMVDTVMEDLMEVMVDTEATEVMDMERERLKLMLSQVMDMVVMVAMVMERERLRPNQDMAAMEDMVMGDLMEVMVDTEAMEDMVMEDLMVVTEATDMVVTVMESRPTSKSKYNCSKYQLNLYMRIFFFLEINIQKLKKK